MNSSEFMLNNQVYTQKKKNKSNTKTKLKGSNNQFFFVRIHEEAYNFVLFINVKSCYKMRFR